MAEAVVSLVSWEIKPFWDLIVQEETESKQTKGMAEAVVSLVSREIKPFGDLIVQEAKFLSGVGNQVQLAQEELHLMGVFLKDADSRAGDDEVVRIWVKLIRDFAYDLEDVIESFALKVVLKGRGGVKRFVCIFSEVVDHHMIGSEIQDIRNKLSSLRSSLESYNIRQTDPERASASKIQKQRDQRQTYADEIETHLVGLEESTKVLADELLKEGKRHRVVSIWGMGGSGKSTLAKQVLVQDDVKRHFAHIVWICISQRCDGKTALKDILTKLTPPSSEEEKKQIVKMKKDEIAEKLYRIQQEQRCLVILDDIWTREAWDSLKAGFPVNGETESRILLTTRKKEVALYASRNDFLHQPKPLDEMQSWELFEKIALYGSNHTDLEIYAKKRELGKKMLKHCSGHPLAIRVLAGLLSRRETIEEWETVLRNVNAYIMRGTNFLERDDTGQEYGVSIVLTLSYDDLPSQLKLCFLYLAQFPADHEIPVKRLMQLWIAEGFIASTSNIYGSVEILEDVAYDCLIELVERSMVQVGERGSTQKVKTCRLHDLMRDLCLQKAKEESFVDVVDFSVSLVSINARPTCKVRRLALYLDNKSKCDFSCWGGRNDQIRSLLNFCPYSYMIDKCSKRVIRSMFNDFKLLRVLKFENIWREFKLPKTIGKLVHLRFLSLKNSKFGALPPYICDLILLQTLDLRVFCDSFFGVVLHGKINLHMEHLRHLYLPDKYTVLWGKLSFAKLCNLQTLVNVNIDKCNLNDLVRVTNLKTLGITAPRSGQFEKFNNLLMSKNITYKHLRSLSLGPRGPYGSLSLGHCDKVIPMDIVSRCPHLCKLRVWGRITKLPKEPQDYQYLSKLTLIDTKLKGEEIEILEKLPRLRTLLFSRNSIESDTLIFSQKGFQCLEFLTFFVLPSLNQWRVEKGAMPHLHRLRITRCLCLREIPDGLQYVTALKELTINGMPNRFCRRVGEGGEDFYKIKHVPSLTIINIKPDEPEMEEAVEPSQAGDSDQESTVDAPPPPPPAAEKTEEIQASSTPEISLVNKSISQLSQ